MRHITICWHLDLKSCFPWACPQSSLVLLVAVSVIRVVNDSTHPGYSLGRRSSRTAGMSMNYSADLQTRVEPRIFGVTPDCSQCGCAIRAGLHWLKTVREARLRRIETLVNGSAGLGSVLGKLRKGYHPHPRWLIQPPSKAKLVQIAGREQ
jgi:hypothetical protein